MNLCHATKAEHVLRPFPHEQRSDFIAIIAICYVAFNLSSNFKWESDLSIVLKLLLPKIIQSSMAYSCCGSEFYLELYWSLCCSSSWLFETRQKSNLNHFFIAWQRCASCELIIYAWTVFSGQSGFWEMLFVNRSVQWNCISINYVISHPFLRITLQGVGKLSETRNNHHCCLHRCSAYSP